MTDQKNINDRCSQIDFDLLSYEWKLAAFRSEVSHIQSQGVYRWKEQYLSQVKRYSSGPGKTLDSTKRNLYDEKQSKKEIQGEDYTNISRFENKSSNLSEKNIFDAYESGDRYKFMYLNKLKMDKLMQNAQHAILQRQVTNTQISSRPCIGIKKYNSLKHSDITFSKPVVLHRSKTIFTDSTIDILSWNHISRRHLIFGGAWQKRKSQLSFSDIELLSLSNEENGGLHKFITKGRNISVITHTEQNTVTPMDSSNSSTCFNIDSTNIPFCYKNKNIHTQSINESNIQSLSVNNYTQTDFIAKVSISHIASDEVDSSVSLGIDLEKLLEGIQEKTDNTYLFDNQSCSSGSSNLLMNIEDCETDGKTLELSNDVLYNNTEILDIADVGEDNKDGDFNEIRKINDEKLDQYSDTRGKETEKSAFTSDNANACGTKVNLYRNHSIETVYVAHMNNVYKLPLNYPYSDSLILNEKQNISPEILQSESRHTNALATNKLCQDRTLIESILRSDQYLPKKDVAQPPLPDKLGMTDLTLCGTGSSESQVTNLQQPSPIYHWIPYIACTQFLRPSYAIVNGLLNTTSQKHYLAYVRPFRRFQVVGK